MKQKLSQLKSRFKRGHIRYESEYKSNGKQKNMYFFREKPKTYSCSESDEYFITHLGSQEVMWNTSTKQHLQSKPKCKGNLKLVKTDHNIISTEWSLHCDSCPFKGDSYKMFKEVPRVEGSRGPLRSTLNLALGAALINSPIGAHVCREILLTLGINPGSESGIQNQITASGIQTVILGLDNLLYEQRKSMSQDDGTGDVISMDTQFRPKIYSSPAPHTFQAGNIAVTTAISNRTKKVVDVHIASKLCAKKQALQGKGIYVQCPEHEGKCTADLQPHESIGDEGRYAKEIAKDLKNVGYGLRGTCTDHDTKAANSFQEEWGEELEQLLDPIHLSKAQKRHTSKMEFSETMFWGRNKDTRDNSKKKFAEEIRQRCSAEISAAIRKCEGVKGSEEKKLAVQNLLLTSPFAILQCYKGIHIVK